MKFDGDAASRDCIKNYSIHEFGCFSVSLRAQKFLAVPFLDDTKVLFFQV